LERPRARCRCVRKPLACMGPCACIRRPGPFSSTTAPTDPAPHQVGWADALFKADGAAGDGVGDDAHSWAFDGARQQRWTGGAGEAYGSAWAPGDVVGCLLDLDSGECRWTLNGSDLGPSFGGLPREAAASASGLCPAVAVEAGEAVRVRVTRAGMRFGPPAGYRAVGDAVALPPAEDPTEEPDSDSDSDGGMDTEERGAERTTAAATAATAAAPALAAPPAPVLPEELPLSGFSGASELEALGLDRLKAALLFRGLKCGGSLAQRAERLWAVRGLTDAEIDPRLKADPPKPKEAKGPK